MGRFTAIFLAVTGTVALQVVAQAIVLISVRFMGHRTRGVGELRRTSWVSLGAVVPLFFGHLSQVGPWAGFLVAQPLAGIEDYSLPLHAHTRQVPA